ncbi:hypothetical protein GTW51_02880 [Aurantimonas aggregata]|uniref:Lipoprotein n=1 Tax=Aurantimonas aggregata TaxID=2047720 RepID=A0A6L9MD91_9HYPH|nr:hypothetical protein [Aurantimonas aggregata]NDV85638.1 hypothetical protein [Aurantimonas aggregata]
MEARTTLRRPIIAAGLCATLASCTGVDPMIGMADAPVPSVDVGYPGMSFSPTVAPAPAYNVATNNASLQPPAPIASAPEPFVSQPAPLPPPSMGQPPAMPPQQAPFQTYEEAPPQQTYEPAPPQQTYEPAPPPAQSVQMAAVPPPAAPASASGSLASREIQFLPLTGAPEDKAVMLARSLSDSAATAGVEIRPAGGPATPVRLKGYFSAFNDGSSTTLVYVWDVLDPNDQRIHRIQGQESVPGTSSDPWADIGQAQLDAVADRTLRDAAALVGQAG